MTTTISRPRGRATAAAVVAGLALSLIATGANAQSFIDPANPCPPDVEVDEADFDDRGEIPPVHRLNVDCAAELGVTVGDEDGNFNPRESTERDQMASFIVRALEAARYELPEPEDQGFEDIEGNEHEEAIQQLAAIGVTEGTTEDTYSPDEFVTRAQMASFILRAAEEAFDDPSLEAVGPEQFSDVSDTNVHKENIEAAAQLLGLTEGVDEGQFEPNQDTERDQMVTFVVRLIDVTSLRDRPGEGEDGGLLGPGGDEESPLDPILDLIDTESLPLGDGLG